MSETTFLFILTTIGAVGMGTLAIFIRMKAIEKPASVKKIIIPPIMMSTGFLMFLYEPAQLPAPQIVAPLLLGIACSYLLIRTSHFEIRDGDIYMQRSKLFIFLLAGLLIVRVIVKLVIGEQIQLPQLAGMFFLLAYGMIAPWRIAMLILYRKEAQQLKSAVWNVTGGERT
ncbi:membrane protein CcdC involved in cytochrome C biogenesis [Geomicrobium halophilum]|uniref:Membrane protein CcdC involved in cytochrome C biogenesis n=1 Tax=Geomicrobium halophilum TaxID=549000 RepID=A0A841PN74_9BACL|nr:cytochrome c biogenesis protein CcdC [Geomicrobium halophilum]MBB6449204.1 membrane protein CcdC involved in cytochrome C biogenesis [Geomicrobium halophilum]